MKKTKHISLPYTYYPSKSPQIQQHLIYNVNYFQPSHNNNNDERCQTDVNNNERLQQQHMKVQSFQAYNQNVVMNKHLCKCKVNKNERQHSHINSRNVHVMKNGNYNTTTTTSFSKEDEIKIMDIKLRCDIIQSRLRKLNCLSLTQNDDRLNRVGGGGVSKDKERCVVRYKEQRPCSNKGNNNGNVSYEEDNLSDIADDIVETFDLEQRFDNNNNVSRSERSNNVNVYNKNMNGFDKEMKIRNTEKAIKDVVLIKEQPVNNVFEIHACRNVQGIQQVQQVNVVNNNNSDVSKVDHYHKIIQPVKSKVNCEFQIEHQESASFIAKIQTPPVEINNNQHSIIIHELSFQTSEHNNNNNANHNNNINVIEHNQHQILNQHNEISTTTTLLTSLTNEHEIQNSNQSHSHLSETDDDKIISQILETAKLQALDNTNNTATHNTNNNINTTNMTNNNITQIANTTNTTNNIQPPYHEQLHQVKSTESYKPSTPPKEFVSSIPKYPSKKVTFNYEQTITIQYNENDLITHLNVYNINYNQLKHKPRIVKNYKTISNIGLKPCISPEYTKHLKLPHTKVQRLSNTIQQHNMNMNSINSSNSSRNSSLRRAVNLKRDSINSNNNKEKNKKYKHKISIVKRKENKICKCQIKQQKQEEHLQQIQKKKVKDNSFDIVTNNKTTKQKKQYINMDVDDHNRKNSV